MGLNFTLKTSTTGCRFSHLDAYTFMEHAHPSCAQVVLSTSLTHCVKMGPKIYAPALQTVECLSGSD
jgi:hypothetical protein